ncbi:hypothetical protein D3C81_538620 [compost metagenome]
MVSFLMGLPVLNESIIQPITYLADVIPVCQCRIFQPLCCQDITEDKNAVKNHSMDAVIEAIKDLR